MAQNRRETPASRTESTPSSEVKCGRCGAIVTPNAYCVACAAWPINVTPIRLGNCGHLVDHSGFCWSCTSVTGTQLVKTACGWRDAGITAKLLSREENAIRMGMLRRILSGEMTKAQVVDFMDGMDKTEPGIGWREGARELEAHVVGFHEDYLPAGMRRTSVVVGHTPSGAEIRNAKPAPARDIAAEKRRLAEEVPF